MFTFKKIAEACCGRLIAGTQKRPGSVSGVSCDSRTIQAGELFIALRGARFDGHAFLKEAFQRGAACAVVDRAIHVGFPIVVVDDTFKALQRLARFHRAKFSIPTVAVTGSVGKTTTKECVGIVLSKFFRVRAGFGNLNNHIGVPLNVLKLSDDDQCFVLELGANHVGEIALLSEIAQPTVGIITGIQPVHLEGFGSVKAIYRAKLELADFLDSTHGTVIANGDDPELVHQLTQRKFSLVTYGTGRHCDYVISHLREGNGFIDFRMNGALKFRLRGYGVFNGINALAAIATAGYFNFDLKSLSESWQALPVIKGRFHLNRWRFHDIQIVDDSYNANPKSFEQALESFHQLARRRRKIVVVGDMLELGEETRSYHEGLGRQLAEWKIDQVIGIGPLSRFVLDVFTNASRSGCATHFEEVEKASQFLASILQEKDSILIKGSHGMQLEKMTSFLEAYLKTQPAVV